MLGDPVEIAARRERVLGARDHDGAHAVVGRDLRDGVTERDEQRTVHRVVNLETAKPNDRDLPLTFERDGSVHQPSPNRLEMITFMISVVPPPIVETAASA